MSNIVNKDFLAFLPSYMQEKLHMKARLYANEPWFKAAWKEYRDICYKSPRNKLPDVDKFFDEYETKFTYNSFKEPVEIKQAEIITPIDVIPDDGVAFSEDDTEGLYANEELEELQNEENTELVSEDISKSLELDNE